MVAHRARMPVGGAGARRSAAAALAVAVLLIAMIVSPSGSAPVQAIEQATSANVSSTTAASMTFRGGMTASVTLTQGTTQYGARGAQLLSTTPHNAYGATSSMFSPGLDPATTPTIGLESYSGMCGGINYTGSCTGNGTMTITFSQPVTDPIMDVSGLGGWAWCIEDSPGDADCNVLEGNGITMATNANGDRTAASWMAQQLTIATPGVTFSSPSGQNLATTATTLTAANLTSSNRCDTMLPTSAETAPYTMTSTALAGCGSVTLNGTFQSVTFNIGTNLVRGPVSGGWANGYNIANTGSPLADLTRFSIRLKEDMGDAPASYDGTSAAAHLTGPLKLGTGVTVDAMNVTNPTTSPNASASASLDTDDAIADGVRAPQAVRGTPYSLAIPLSGTAQAGTVAGWIDFDKNGLFDTGERVSATFAAGATSVVLTWTVPTTVTSGDTYLRLRASFTASEVSTPRGVARSGEVEDYILSLALAPQSVVTECDNLWFVTNAPTGGSTPGTYGYVNPDTGVWTTLGQLSDQSSSLAIDPNTNIAYYGGFTPSVSEPNDGILYRLDLATGVSTQLNTTAHPMFVSNRLTVAPDGTLWSMTVNGNLWSTVPTATTIGTPVNHGLVTGSGATGITAGGGDIAFDGLGNLYILSFDLSASRLWVISAQNMAADIEQATYVGPMGGSTFPGIAFDGSGDLFGISGTTLYQVDPATGGRTTVATGGPASLGDLASCATPAPELDAIKNVSPAGGVYPGAVLTYTIEVENTGSAVATGVTLADAIPANTTYVAGSTTLNGAAVADVSGVFPYATPREIRSPGSFAGVIPAGATATVVFQVRVNDPFPSNVTQVANQGFVNANGLPQTPTDWPLTPTVDDPVITPVSVATVSVTKAWVVDGVPYANGSQPAGLSAQLLLGGPGTAGPTPQGWGVPRTGYVPGSTATVSETVSLGSYSACDTTAVITRINGAAMNVPLTSAGYGVTVTAPTTAVEVTNTVTCEQNLTLVKVVAHGDEPTSTWMLDADGPAGALAGPAGTHSPSSPVTAPVTSGVPYALAESGGPDTYVAVGDWSCTLTDDVGTVVPVAQGAVTVPRGRDVTCTVTNATASLTLLKHVLDPVPGFQADAWELTATPAALVGGFLPTETRTGAETDVAGANTFEVRPGHEYTLSEASIAQTLAYRQVGLERFDGTNWVPVASGTITAPAAGETATYRFVNAQIPPVTLPLTGGVAADAILIAGAAVIALSAVGALWTIRRRRHA